MRTGKILLLAALLMLAAGLAFGEGAQETKEWPSRSIEIVVGWSAGGTSDTTCRALAGPMSDYLGEEVTVTNMGGANGGIAYQTVADSDANGYRLFGGAQVQATYPITKQAEIGWEAMYPFPAGMGATTIYVRTDSGYDTIEDLVDAIKSSKKTVNYGHTSRGGNGHIFGEAFIEAAGITDKVKDIPYDGGREAGNYLIAGEVEFISVSLGDVSDWAEEGTLEPLLNLYKEDFEWRGVTFPSVANYYPNLVPYTSINPYWGFAVDRETPEDVVIKLAEAFEYAVKQDSFKDALEARGIIVAPQMGETADESAAIVGAGRGWAQYKYGIVDTSPAKFNVPKLANWEFPYNESSESVQSWPEEVEEIFEGMK
ncbi:MAG: tripartite tricarboxylate transporter substrate binding protein [Spirochaetia bacterium]|nr:tripartite tricarboxylate transporter substrate binding protein [Spirochaetia bacterium]MCF7945311.1 tripartite tricarboxylate transporter substrate binding protein [Spirochaetia bacterium]MCF7946594.1 tripartite tricarboxylate transporter substrate binding protein [Spirochaetia bacterium]